MKHTQSMNMAAQSKTVQSFNKQITQTFLTCCHINTTKFLLQVFILLCMQT